MGNVANTEKYKEYWQAKSALFDSKNFKGFNIVKISEKYAVKVAEYGGEVEKYNLRGSECKLLEKDR